MFGVISIKTGGQDGVIVLPRAGLGGDGVPRRPSYTPPPLNFVKLATRL